MQIPEIAQFWTKLEEEEIFLMKKVNFFIDGNAKYIIGAMLKGMQETMEGEEDFEESMPVEEYISNALALNKIYERILITSKLLFLYGISSGKAMFNSEFNNNFDIENVIENQEVEKLITETKEEQLKKIESNSKAELESKENILDILQDLEMLEKQTKNTAKVKKTSKLLSTEELIQLFREMGFVSPKDDEDNSD